MTERVRGDDDYLELDTITVAIDSLEKAEAFLDRTDDKFRWKWVVSTLTSSMYHFVIAAMVGVNYSVVVDFERMPRKLKKALKALPSDLSTPSYLARRAVRDKYLHSGKAKLISYKEAMKRIQSGRYKPYNVISDSVKFSQQEYADILSLRVHFRDPFEHYKPMTWYIENRLLCQKAINLLEGMKKVVGVNSHMFTLHSLNSVDTLDRIDRMLAKMAELA